MKTIVLWDVHGRDTRKEIIKKENPDKVVFIGDYFDSFNISIQNQLDNYDEIVDYKKNNRDSCVLLLGNHDYQYLPYVEETYSWFSPVTKMQVSQSLDRLTKMWYMKIVHVEWKHLFSHAGISKTRLWDLWVDNINDIFLETPQRFWKISREPYWNHKTEWPLRIRQWALLKDWVDWYTQVYWHTQSPIWVDIDNWFINVDALHMWEYLIIEDWVAKIWNL